MALSRCGSFLSLLLCCMIVRSWWHANNETSICNDFCAGAAVSRQHAQRSRRRCDSFVYFPYIERRSKKWSNWACANKAFSSGISERLHPQRNIVDETLRDDDEVVCFAFFFPTCVFIGLWLVQVIEADTMEDDWALRPIPPGVIQLLKSAVASLDHHGRFGRTMLLGLVHV